MVESGLMWKSLPVKISVQLEDRKLDGGKAKKDRIAIGPCVNAKDTHKLPLFFIHKFDKPRSLKNCDNLSVVYKVQRNAWMDQDVFLDWFENCFKISGKDFHVRKGTAGKVFLLLDNYSSHILPFDKIKDDEFEIILLPTSVIQPVN